MNQNALIKILNRIEGKVDNLTKNVKTLFQGELIIMSQLTDALDFAEAAAAENSAADDSAEKLLLSLADMIAKLKDGVTDPAAIARISALADGVKARAAQLAAAVVAGTPAETPPVEEPPVEEPPVGGSTLNV